jgi:hypothetical protein
MRFLVFCAGAAVLAGCARPEDRTAREGEESAAMPAAAAPISLADVSGKWKVRSTDEAGGNLVESELTATADTSGWTMLLPNRKPIPVRVVAVAGDSFVTEAGPFESAIKKGVQVRTRTVNRLQDGKLVGVTEARYKIKGADSVAYRRTEATRAP